MFRVIVVRMPKVMEECEYFSHVQGCTRSKPFCKCTFYNADTVGDKYLKGVRYCDGFIDLKSYKKLDRKCYLDNERPHK